LDHGETDIVFQEDSWRLGGKESGRNDVTKPKKDQRDKD
jgi:hypothetical protein